MASEARRVMGSIDAVMAATGHKSLKMAEHYGAIPTNLQRETIAKVGSEIESRWKKLKQIPIINAEVGKSWDEKKALR